MTKQWFWSLLSVLMLTAALQGQSRESVLKAVAQDSGWSPDGKPSEYNEKNITDLVGNRASAINHYGLIGATTQSWHGRAGTVRLTLYEMVDASAAYGLFTLDRHINQPGFTALPLGSEGFRVSNRTFFWQSNYVVKLEGSVSAADNLARLLSENILGRSRKPPVSSHLPPQNLVQGSEKYVLDGTGIGPELGLDRGMLGFEDSVEVAIADYLVDGKSAHLVLLLYPTQQVAKKYAVRWEANATIDPALQKRVGPLVALVRGSRDPAVARTILDAVNYETQVTWNEPRPDIAFRDVILTIFAFIGIGLLFTLVAGLSYGGLRIFVKARYPDRIFDRSEDMEIIQLKLGQGVIHKELPE
jgi:hypothetical protein